MIPNQSTLLLSGIPATGKSAFAKHLVGKWDFVHYDLESYPDGWPQSGREEEYRLWGTDRRVFVSSITQKYDRIVLDWGFPVPYLGWIQELQAAGVKLVWFDGDTHRARENFIRRGKGNVHDFDRQVEQIQLARFPDALRDCTILKSLSSQGKFLSFASLERLVFH